MTSLRAKLYALWFLLVISAVATGGLLYALYAQSAAVQLSQTEIAVSRACQAISDRYAFYATGWVGPGTDGVDERLRQDLVDVVEAALMGARGIEGGLWAGDSGSLAYAFPTYEGTGPKTDVPAAELSTIARVNADALRDGQARTLTRPGSSQTLVLRACPLTGAIPNLTAWAMARVFTGRGPAYNQLLLGLGVLALTVLGSALFLGRMLLVHSGRIAGLEHALSSQSDDGVLPELKFTGEHELDRLVGALNLAGEKLAEARSRLVTTERLAAIGSLAAGVAHEVRNPMAAMRLKAENALASGDPERARAALATVLDQVGRLDGLLGDLLGLTQPRTPHREPTDVDRLVADIVRLHADHSERDGVTVSFTSGLPSGARPMVDADQIGRALSNLLLNALHATAESPHGKVEIATRGAGENDRERLLILVSDNGPGIPASDRERIFEPFETNRAGGSGLGLAIVREIARAHGGTVRLVPTNTGSVFQLDLPWRES